jgi:hypothetical protein
MQRMLFALVTVDKLGTRDLTDFLIVATARNGMPAANVTMPVSFDVAVTRTLGENHPALESRRFYMVWSITKVA